MEENVVTTGRQTRREFCIHICRSGSLIALSGSLGHLFVACGDDAASVQPVPDLPVIQATVSNNTITLTIDSNSPLFDVGSAARVQHGGGQLLVAHTSQDSFTALTAICTHQGCTITGYNSQTYQCPCHGSQFNTGGQVVRGPATASLQSFATQFANGQLTITLG